MSTEGGLGGGLSDAPPDDIVSALRDYQRLALEQEGIGMFLAVHDARAGRRLAVSDDAARAEGARLRALYEQYADQLDDARPSPTPDDPVDPTGARQVIEPLAVLSDHHLTTRTTRTTGSADSSPEDDRA